MKITTLKGYIAVKKSQSVKPELNPVIQILENADKDMDQMKALLREWQTAWHAYHDEGHTGKLNLALGHTNAFIGSIEKKK